jgi:murein DD-endopeptidase MepM/ murein hydrolase activator NlpD
MKSNLNKIKKKIKKNIELFFLLFLILISILTVQIYNNNKIKIYQNYTGLINNIYFQKSFNHILNNLKPKYLNVEHVVSSGETFDQILKNYNISEYEIKIIKKNIASTKNINNLKTNQVLKFTIEQLGNRKITNFILPITRTKKIQLTRIAGSDEFKKLDLITNLSKKIVFKEGKILQSLYKTAINLKIKPNIIIEFARIYGFQVDFQRDIKKNDRFQIMYEVFEDDKGKVFETGNIIYADLKLSGQRNSLYFFDNKKDEGHYDKNGKSVKKALMKTPINGARLSSSFGIRKHPIDGYNKMHRGTDFAAPKGTPIMASGDGVVIRAKWCGGGGNCIKIKHNSTYQTIYAHISKFAAEIRTGIRVKQGQIIGYVGSTGNSTGPHLHYEVVENGKKINSQKLKLPSGKVLKGKNRKLFEIQKIKLDVLKSELILGLN